MSEAIFPVQDYDLAATLSCGQAFRWELEHDGWWVGVIGSHWVRLRHEKFQIIAEATRPVSDWTWLREYLQLDVCLKDILATFP